MTVRAIIIAFTVPLFMLLACVNGALLYVQDKAEMTRALDAQAMAAAVTTAQFLSATPDATMLPPEQMAKHMAKYMQRLSGAAVNIAGLKRLVFVRDNAPDIILSGSPASADSEHIVSASAPVEFGAESGGAVLAHIDSMPMYETLSALQYRIALLVIGAGFIGAILGWFLGGKISHELNHVMALIDGFFDGPVEGTGNKLTIRETIDLSNAVHLMGASMRAARLRQNRQKAYVEDNRDEDKSVQSYRKSCFAPVMSEISGTAIAMRMLGNAPAGSFYAIAQNEQEAAIIVGECDGDSPASALANALAAQKYFERNLLDCRILDGQAEKTPAEKIIESGRKAFSITEINWVKWEIASPPPRQIMALFKDNDSKRADAYHALNPALAPDTVIDDLTALLKPDGVIAALGPASKTT